MKLKKSETNNAIIVKLENVRKHPNPKVTRIKLATVLGTQIVVDVDSQEGDIVVYFDANLRISHAFLHHNNLYSNRDMNADISRRGFFGKNGRVRAIKLQNELSNGFVCPIDHLFNVPTIKTPEYSKVGLDKYFEVGDEFTHINDVEICSKYIAFAKPVDQANMPGRKGSKRRRNIIIRTWFGLLKRRVWTDMFWKHWDTKHLMREKHRFPEGIVYIEEKMHGTSGRTANVLVHKTRRRYQFWKPKVTSTWEVLSGTRRMDDIYGHMGTLRREIHEKLKPLVRKGEQLYYEIVGYSKSGQLIQSLSGVHFTYGCAPGNYKVVLYRVTRTNVDGLRVELNREEVYRRAEELGLEKPMLIRKGFTSRIDTHSILAEARGKSLYDVRHCLEGIVVWFQGYNGVWTCLKHKSEEYTLLDSRNKDEGGGDVEDLL